MCWVVLPVGAVNGMGAKRSSIGCWNKRSYTRFYQGPQKLINYLFNIYA